MFNTLLKSFFRSKVSCHTYTMIRIISIVIITFVLLTIYLLHTQKTKEQFEDEQVEQNEEDIEKPSDADLEKLDKELSTPAAREEEIELEIADDMIPPPQPPLMIPLAPKQPRVQHTPPKPFAPFKLENMSQNMTTPEALKELVQRFNKNNMSSDELISSLDNDIQTFDPINVDNTPLPVIDDIISFLNVLFVPQSIFVDTVLSSTYFTKMTKSDLIARKAFDQSTNVPSIDVYMSMYMSGYQPFSQYQKAKVIRAVLAANQILSPFRSLYNIKWKFAKIDSNLESGFPHTLKDIIIINDNFLNNNDFQIMKTLIHEKIHILQRYYPDKANQLIELLDFVPLNTYYSKSIDHVLKSLIRNNPDLDGKLYFHQPLQRVVTQLYNNSEPLSLGDSRAVSLALKRYGKHMEILSLSNELLGLPSSMELLCQLEHPYEISACLLSEILTNSSFSQKHMNNIYVVRAQQWLKNQT
jgi:hypothetical protein